MTESLKKIREALELALSFAPKGPVPEGLAPMFYHTLNYEDECKLQKRIDEARSCLALLDTLPTFPSVEEYEKAFQRKFKGGATGYHFIAADWTYAWLRERLGLGDE